MKTSPILAAFCVVAALDLASGVATGAAEAGAADARTEKTLQQKAKAGELTPEEKLQVEEVNRKFAGLSFGVALSVTADTGDRDRVDDAFVDASGTVRVNKKSNIRARVMLESHYFFGYQRMDADKPDLMRAGWGPFVALQPGTDEIIDAIGLGVMFGWRRSGTLSGQSFNLGIGFAVDPSVKVLGDEFVEGDPAPLDSDGDPLPIRYQERDQGGVLLLASFGW